MQKEAARSIDRGIRGVSSKEKTSKELNTDSAKTAQKQKFKPVKGKYRKPGTGCVYQVNDTPWEGSFFPRLPDGKRKKFNVYAKTRDECEKLLAEMIEKKKAEIAEMKKKAKGV